MSYEQSLYSALIIYQLFGSYAKSALHNNTETIYKRVNRKVLAFNTVFKYYLNNTKDTTVS